MRHFNYLIAVMMLFAALVTANAANNGGKAVRYTVLHNYFHNNNAPLPSSPLVTTQEEFDKQFGMAAYMGKDGQPTAVNFRKQAVLAIVLPETNKATDIDSVTVTETGKQELTLAYTVHEGVEHGYTTQPVYLMAVDKKYKKYEVRVVPTVRHEISTSTTAYETVLFKDARHNIDLTIDYPTQGDAKVVTAIRLWLGKRLATMSKGFALQDKPVALMPSIQANTTAKNFVEASAEAIAKNMDMLNEDNGVYGNPNRCSLMATVSRVYENGRFVSFEANGYSFTGGAHGMSFCDGATFDKLTGKQVKLVKEAPALLKLVTDKLHKTTDIQHFNSEPVPMPQAQPYIVSGGKIKFVYQPYEIGAYAIGMPACEFYPYELEQWLTDEGKALMY